MLSEGKRYFRKSRGQERGEVMLEGMFVIIITMFMLIWVLGIGFVYYQRYTTTVVTNDVAVKIASTYNNPTSDIIMGYVTTEDLSERDLYRGFTTDSYALCSINQERAENYVKYVLDKANFTGVIEDVIVELELIQDSSLRRHVKITTVCTFNTPFRQALELFGMNGQLTYEATACADYTDVADYVSTASFMKSLGSGSYLGDEKFVQNLMKMINSIIKAVNHYTS